MNSDKKGEITDVFTRLGDEPSIISDGDLNILEYFVCHMYSSKKRCQAEININEMRLKKFKLSSNNDLRIVPPSKNALLQHVKRACYQAGYLWKEALSNIEIPDPNLWGWKGLYKFPE